MRKKQNPRVELREGPVEHRLLEDLFKARGLLPAEEIRSPEEETSRLEETLRQPDYSKVERVVLRYERKGHGGKSVTRVEGVPFAEDALEDLARELKKSLGCGAWVEGNEILLQGDLTERSQAWFQKKGVRRVVISRAGGFRK
jgi:translation initiation factor 1 (eIF-1/SUI1)